MYAIPSNLSQLEHLRQEKSIVFKEEVVDDVKVIIPAYMIGNSGLWKIPFARECRGHVYNADSGELIGVALHKFFNVDENEESLKRNIKWDNVSNYQEKIDGSMITVAVINGKPRFKTKKSFYSEVAIKFNEYFDSIPEKDNIIAELTDLIGKGIFPIFEFYHPEWEIVLRYSEDPKIWVTQFRDISGKYLTDVDDNVLKWFPRKKQFDKNMDIFGLCDTIVGVEGWVIHDTTNDEFYKLKTKDYLIKHRVRTEYRERDFAVLIIDEKIDDVKSSIVESGYSLDKLEELEKRVYADLVSIVEVVDSIVEECQHLSLKDAALRHNNHPYFGLIMYKLRGKTPNYREYFLKNILKEKYSLRCLYNENFSGE